MIRSLIFFTWISITLGLNAQQVAIQIDGEFGDWQALSPAHLDLLGDGRDGIDFRQVFVSNDPDYLFLHFTVGKELNIQDDNAITIYLDIDNNASTGLSSNGIGAELRYTFGSRNGRFQYSGNSTVSIDHEEIGLVSLPSVTSDRFEIAIKRSGTINGRSYAMRNEIKLVLKDLVGGGDALPNNGGVDYAFKNIPSAITDYSLTKDPDDIRVLSYNSEFDGFFEFATRDQQRRIITAMDPDVIGFQEIYDFTSAQVVNVVQDLIDGPLFHAKRIPDVHCISRFPIIDQSSINGNGAFLLDLGEKDLLFIVTHFPCCDRDFDRQEEIDNVMKFIRESKANENFVPIRDETPIVIVGDMNLVGFSDQLNTLISGDIVNNAAFGPDLTPDWDGSDLQDALPLISGLPLAYTYEDENSSFGPGRLDFVLYTGSVLRKTNGFILKTETLDAQERNAIGLQATDSQGSDHLPVIVDFSLDVSVSNSNLKSTSSNAIVYPQPAIDRLYFDTPYDIIDIQLLNMQGQLILKADSYDPSIGLDLNDIPSGTYALVLDFGDLRMYDKILIAK